MCCRPVPSRARPPTTQRAPPAPQPRRRVAAPRPPPFVLAVLEALEASCNCKSSLLVSCARGSTSGCRERQRDGRCDCKPRLLPTCIQGTPGGHGCARWREGKTCQCPRELLPRCLVVGCDRRRKGQRCECARTSTELCPHVLARIAAYAELTAAQAERTANRWAELLWALLPATHRDRPPPYQGYPAPTRADAVNLMSFRHSVLKVGLWHPDDVRGTDGGGLTTRQQLRRQAQGLQRLRREAASPKARLN